VNVVSRVTRFRKWFEMSKVRIKYRKNSHEKYFSYIRSADDPFMFDLVKTTFLKTDADRIQVVLEKVEEKKPKIKISKCNCRI